MKISNILSLFGLCGLLTTGCSPRLEPFTTETMRDINTSDDNLKRIQFYLSDEVVLFRDVTQYTGEITSGKIQRVEGREVEEIRIKRGTPGVFLFRVKEKNFAVSFDEGSEKRYLTFGPNPKRGGTYVLLATEWKDQQGKVNYDDKLYFATGESAFASLLVNMDKVRKTAIQSRVARGRVVQ